MPDIPDFRSRRLIAEFLRQIGYRRDLVTFKGFVYFVPVDGNVAGRADPNLYVAAADVENRDLNLVSDYETFILFSRKNQHYTVPLWRSFIERETTMPVNPTSSVVARPIKIMNPAGLYR
jgi:hypothetical protein